MRNAPAVQRYYKPDELVQYSVVISKYCKVQRGLCDFQPVTKLSCKHCWQHTNKVSISWQENKNIHRDSLCVGWSSWNANSPCRFENSISPLHGFSSNDDDSELRPMWSFSSPVQFLLEIVKHRSGIYWSSNDVKIGARPVTACRRISYDEISSFTSAYTNTLRTSGSCRS